MRLKVGPYIYTVRLVEGAIEHEGDRCLGLCDNERHEILVADVATEVQQVQVICHEYMEAWIYHFASHLADDDAKESFCDLFGVAMAQCMLDFIGQFRGQLWGQMNPGTDDDGVGDGAGDGICHSSEHLEKRYIRSPRSGQTAGQSPNPPGRTFGNTARPKSTNPRAMEVTCIKRVIEVFGEPTSLLEKVSQQGQTEEQTGQGQRQGRNTWVVRVFDSKDRIANGQV